MSPMWSAFLRGGLQPCKTMTNTLTPVEHTNWALSAWNSTLDRNDVPLPGCVVRTICGQLRTSCVHLESFSLLPTHPHPHPLLPPTPFLFNRLLSPVLLNKSSLVYDLSFLGLNNRSSP